MNNLNEFQFIYFSFIHWILFREREEEKIHLAMCCCDGCELFSGYLHCCVCVCNVKSITLTFSNRRCVTFPFSFPFKCYKNFAVLFSWFLVRKTFTALVLTFRSNFIEPQRPNSVKNIMPFINNRKEKTNKYYSPFQFTINDMVFVQFKHFRWMSS